MNRRLRLITLIALSCVVWLKLTAQVAPSEDWQLPEDEFPALKQLLETALEQSPRMLARNTEETVAEANRIATRAAQLPSAGGYYSYYPFYREQTSSQGTQGEPRQGERETYGFSISQPLYHWSALRNGTRIYELQKEITQVQTGEAYRLLANEIRAQFLQLAIKKAGLARARVAQQQAQAALDLAEDKLQHNIIAQRDLFYPQLAVEQASLAADRAQDDYDSSRLLLGKLCGIDAISDEQIPSLVPHLVVPADRIESLLSDKQSAPPSHSLQILDRQIEAEKLTYKIARTRLRPKVNLVTGISQDQSYTAVATGATDSGVTSTYAGLSVNWTIFDGFATKASKAASLARRRQLERNRRELTADLAEQARTKLRQLQYSERALEISARLLRVAEGGVSGTRDNVSRGLAAETDLRAAEYNLSSAQIDTYSARYDYIMKLCDLLSFLHLDPALENLPVRIR
jgi:outer membrane protein TolC